MKGCMKGMKKKVLAFAAAAVLAAPQMVGAEGFAIYEWSAEGLAMGGARMLRYVPSIPTLVRVFVMNGCWTLSNAFSASVEMII